MGIFQSILYKYLLFLIDKNTFFFEYNTSNPKRCSSYYIYFKILDILVSFRVIAIALKLMDTKVKLAIMLNDCFV